MFIVLTELKLMHQLVFKIRRHILRFKKYQITLFKTSFQLVPTYFQSLKFHRPNSKHVSLLRPFIAFTPLRWIPQSHNSFGHLNPGTCRVLIFKVNQFRKVVEEKRGNNTFLANFSVFRASNSSMH